MKRARTVPPQRVDAPPVGADAITDVAGIKVGHSTDPRGATGCSVVLAEAGAVAGVDVRGAAPGTRETDLLEPTNLIDRVHAIVLAGGSAFGLDSAGGVMRYLAERGIGYDTGIAKIPIVPAAILFDLAVGDPAARPDAAAGYAAARSATARCTQGGNVGAGTGASVGKLFGMARAMKGGIGTASVKLAGITVGAMVAVNAIGDVIDPATGAVIAGARTADGKHLMFTTRAILDGELPERLPAGSATTLAVVATDAVLTKAQARKVAQMAHDGLARAIDPAHTMYDGDTVFTLATGTSGNTGDVTLIGIMAADVVARAIVRAALIAQSVSGLPAHRDLARSPYFIGAI